MEVSRRNPLVDPEYEQDVKLKVDLVKTVYANCLKKLMKGTDNTPTSSKLRAIRYTGIPESVYPNQSQKKFQVSNIVKNKIRPIIEEIIHDQYIVKQILPVLKHIVNANQAWIAAVRQLDITKAQLSVLLDKNNLPILMKKLGYKWQRLPGTDKKFIIERPEYVNARHNYLKRLTKYREEQRSIIYLEILNLTEKLDENWNKADSEGTASVNFVIIAILPATGLLCNTHCGKNVRTAILQTIVKVSLLQNTSENSVIIIGDDHGVVREFEQSEIKWPNRNEMIAWLDYKGIPYNADMHKCELFDLCQKFTSKSPKQDKWEEMLTASGRVVLRRPRWMHDFGIFYEFWPCVKSDNRLTKFRVARNFEVFTSHVRQTQWHTFEQILIRKEAKLMKRDKHIEDVIENVIVMVKAVGLCAEDLDLNDFDDVPSSDDEM